MKLRSVAAALVLAGVLSGCGDSTGSTSEDGSTSATTPTRATEADPAPATTTQATRGSSAAESEGEVEAELSPLQGIDASHHQGPIDWARVADHGVAFAYLKASEGTGFVDPRFADHRTAAGRYGIAVAGYHYFQLCSDGAAQAAHFIEVLGEQGPGALAPALDLEVAGSCADPPARDVLLSEVREFLSAVDEEYATKTVVYLYPDFEDRFGFAEDLADHPQWVRRLGDRAPRRPWLVWQYDDHGSVPGIAGPVDLNLMQPVS
ncbi:MAG: GH25 family lysozyme [Propionibacteriales bacterium]|nr:GH25 family lysozyme [Propionibacteriales bacterium]